MAFTNIIDIIYPVGSIYQSMSSTSPATLFGGTWAAINTFLYGQSTAGNTGGESTHTLTKSELPYVYGRWDLRGLDDSYVSSGSSCDGNAKYVTYSSGAWILAHGNSLAPGYSSLLYEFGENKAHNNLPPYTTCYIWKRTV